MVLTGDFPLVGMHLCGLDLTREKSTIQRTDSRRSRFLTIGVNEMFIELNAMNSHVKALVAF